MRVKFVNKMNSVLEKVVKEYDAENFRCDLLTFLIVPSLLYLVVQKDITYLSRSSEGASYYYNYCIKYLGNYQTNFSRDYQVNRPH